MTTEDLQRELAEASQVIAALTAKLDRANETIEGLEATIGSLRHERDRERLAHAKSWDAMSARIARLEEALDALTVVIGSTRVSGDLGALQNAMDQALVVLGNKEAKS